MSVRSRLTTFLATLGAPEPGPGPIEYDRAKLDEERAQLDSDREIFHAVARSLSAQTDSAVDASGFGSSVDRDSTTKPGKGIRLSLRQRRDVARYSPICRRILAIRGNRVAVAGWDVRGPGEDEDGQEVERLGLTASEDARLGIAHVLSRGMYVAGRDGGAYALFYDGKPLDQALSGQITQIAIRLCDEITISEFQVEDDYGIGELTPAHREDRPAQHRYRLSTQFRKDGGSFTDVHPSRVIYIPGLRVDLQDRVNSAHRIDDSRVDAMWPYLQRIEVTAASGSNIARMLSLRVVKSTVQSGAKKFLEALQLKARTIARQQSVLGVTVLTEGEEMQVLASNVAGYSDLADEQWSGLAAAEGLPLTLLKGESPGGLNSDGKSARDHVNDLIAEYVETDARPFLRAVYEKIAQQPGVALGDGWSIRFNPASPPTRHELAQLELLHAQRDAILIDKRVIMPSDSAKRFGEQYSDDLPEISTEGREDDPAAIDPALLAALGASEEAEALPTLPDDAPAQERPVEAAGAEELPPLNGAQITSGLQVIGQAAAGQITPEIAQIVLEQWLRQDPSSVSAIVSELSKVEPAALLPAQTDARDLTAPQSVREELRRGLKWHEDGHSGDGLKPETVAWARRLASGDAITRKKAVEMRAWFARHKKASHGKGYDRGEPGYPSPGRVAWALWGGDAAVGWSSDIVAYFERQAEGD